MKYYHIDSFSSELFRGNPAGVCILGDSWLPEQLMQNIAFEINLSETAFVICRDGEYHIRWFTPAIEVDLCGHATFAAFYVIANFEGYEGNSIRFRSASGELRAFKDGDLITIDLPAANIEPKDYLWDFECFDSHPIEVYAAKDEYMFVFEREEQIANIVYDLGNIAKVDSQGIIVTAPGNGDLDFVSRYFGPNCGIPEDPVTGAAHTLLVPYWTARLDKTSLEAAQLSKRGGRLSCRLEQKNQGTEPSDGRRVLLSGHGKLFMRGSIIL